MRIKIAFIILFTYCVNVFSQDEGISFIAEISKKTLGINENLRVDFKMNQDFYVENF